MQGAAEQVDKPADRAAEGGKKDQLPAHIEHLGGAIGWFVYLLCRPLQNDIVQFFIATVVITIYSEVMARIHKVPVTGYLLIALLPMVPGGGIYYTMEYCIAGNTQMFLETGLHTLGIAGALALGILLVSSLNRLFGMPRRNKNNR